MRAYTLGTQRVGQKETTHEKCKFKKFLMQKETLSQNHAWVFWKTERMRLKQKI